MTKEQLQDMMKTVTDKASAELARKLEAEVNRQLDEGYSLVDLHVIQTYNLYAIGRNPFARPSQLNLRKRRYLRMLQLDAPNIILLMDGTLLLKSLLKAERGSRSLHRYAWSQTWLDLRTSSWYTALRWTWLRLRKTKQATREEVYGA